jgi:hypothetical protein
MEVEFHDGESPDEIRALAIWRDGRVEVQSEDAATVSALEKVFRRTPIVVDDGAYRRLGASGEVVLQPGDLEWFRAVAQVRAPAETGLIGRLVPGVAEGGYDPAASYRTFEESIERLESGSA